jgi:hypothetical protein
MNMVKINNSFSLRQVCLWGLFGGLATLTGCTDSVRLAPRLKSGQTYAQKVHFLSDLRMMFPYADYQDSEMVLKYKVNEVNSEGVATVTVTIDSIKASMRSLSIVCKYDSETPAESKEEKRPGGKPSHQEQYTRSFEGVKGSKFSAQVDAQGRLLKFLEVDKKIQKFVSGPISSAYFGGYQLALLFSETNLRDYVSLWMYGFLAGAEPEVGKTWTGYMPVESSQTAPVMALKNYTLKSVDEKDGDKIATFALGAKGPVKQPALPEYVAVNLKRRKPEMEIVKVEHGSGEAVLSLSGGHPIKFYEKIITEVRLAGKKNQELLSRSKNQKKTFYFMEKTIEYISK